MAYYINYKAELTVENKNFTIIENLIDNTNDITSFNTILENIENLKNSSDLFLQNVIDQNIYLLSCGNKKIEDEEENIDDS